LTYEIPKGIADDNFAVDSLRGIVTTKGTFDREIKDLYTIPIYVMEAVSQQFKTTGTSNGSKKAGKFYKAQFDMATIVVRVLDINDHTPEFRPGSCYPLSIPENSESSIIHRVVATDSDEGLNGEITYSITGTISIEISLSKRLFYNSTRRFFLRQAATRAINSALT
jgi:protocadherin-16/23